MFKYISHFKYILFLYYIIFSLTIPFFSNLFLLFCLMMKHYFSHGINCKIVFFLYVFPLSALTYMCDALSLIFGIFLATFKIFIQKINISVTLNLIGNHIYQKIILVVFVITVSYDVQSCIYIL